MLGGGLGIFIINLINDWRKAKRGDTQDVIGAWQEIANREAVRSEVRETRERELTAELYSAKEYIGQLLTFITEAGLKAPKRSK